MKKIAWSQEARADIRRIDQKIAMRIFTVIRRFAETGAGDVKELKGQDGELRLRVGDYRVRFRTKAMCSRFTRCGTEEKHTDRIRQEDRDLKITYGRNADALYVRFKETTVTTKHMGEGIAADYDADGHLAGIEVLDAVKRLGDPTAFKRVTLEDVAIAR